MNCGKSLGLSTCLISILLTLFTSVLAGSPLTQYEEDEQGITPLMRAVRDGEREGLKELLKNAADIDAKDPEGWTALIYAVVRQDEDAIKPLINSRADVNVKDNEGNTALMHAAMRAKASIIKRLIDGGANVNERNSSGSSALAIAMKQGSKDVVRMLEKAGGIAITPEAGSEPLRLVTAYDQRPRPVNMPRPNYTEEAREHKVKGVVSLRLLIDNEGRVKRVRILRGLPYGLSQEARRSAYQIRFNPAMKDGQPVEARIPVDIEFNLK